jgi:hypothetical protein
LNPPPRAASRYLSQASAKQSLAKTDAPSQKRTVAAQLRCPKAALLTCDTAAPNLTCEVQKSFVDEIDTSIFSQDMAGNTYKYREFTGGYRENQIGFVHKHNHMTRRSPKMLPIEKAAFASGQNLGIVSELNAHGCEPTFNKLCMASLAFVVFFWCGKNVDFSERNQG